MAQSRNEIGEPMSPETGVIQGEIARTRTRMSGTIGEIQERLRPNHLIQRARESVQGAAAGRLRGAVEYANCTAREVAATTRRSATRAGHYVQQHPMPTLLVGAGAAAAALLAARRRGNGKVFEGSLDTYGDRLDRYDTNVTATPRASSEVRQEWRQVASSLNRWVRDHPAATSAIGAAALAVGAVVAASVRGNGLENRTLGEIGADVKARATDAARRIRQTVSTRAQQVAEAVTGETSPLNAPDAGAKQGIDVAPF